MKKEPKETLAQRMLKLRQDYDLSQSEFASYIGMKGHQGILKIESGETAEPRKSTLLSIANVYGTTMEWLLEGSGEMLPNGKKQLRKATESTSDLPWKDEAWTLAKDQINQKDNQLNSLLALISKLDLSFLHPVAKTGS